MKGEIDRDFYCSADEYDNGNCKRILKPGHYDQSGCNGCKFLNRKWPTPEQYREEYGQDYPKDGAVYLLWTLGERTEWTICNYRDGRSYLQDTPRVHRIIICACTPWGNPPADWRPS